MGKQFHINMSDNEILIIDLKEDESVTVQIDHPPVKFEKETPLVTMFRVDGLRWKDDKHYHLGWLEKSLNIGDEITIKLIESEQIASPPSKDEEYIPPEEECNFCHKKKSEVEYLVEKNFMARICNECIDVAQKVIEEKRDAT